MWYDVEEKIDVTWNGRITRVEKTTKSKDSLLAIIYWEKYETKDDGDKYPIGVCQLAVDLYFDDLFFI